jgi:Protein of unknown function (DUF2934)
MARAKSGIATAEKKVSARTKKSSAPANGSNGAIEGQGPQALSLTDEQVRQRAYELYERRGRQHGADESDWFAAEAELRSRTA